MRWEIRKSIEYLLPLDSYKLRLIKANMSLLPPSMNENYKSLLKLRTFAIINFIASFFIVFFAYPIINSLRM